MKYIFIIFFLPLVCFSYHKSNFEIIDSLTREISHKTVNYALESGINSASYSLNPSSFSWLFDKNLPIAASNSKLKLLNESENKLNIFADNIKVYYQYLNQSKDSLIRVIEIDYAINFQDKTIKKNISKSTIQYSDFIHLDDISIVESDDYKFTKGIPPKSNLSFYKSIIEPVIILSSAALSVILFFSIRSQ